MDAATQTNTHRRRYQRRRPPMVRRPALPSFTKIPFIDLLELIVTCFITLEMFNLAHAINYYFINNFYFLTTMMLFISVVGLLIKTHFNPR